MEVYIGSTWMEVAVSSPNLDGGARGLIMGGYSPGSGDGESRVNVIESVVISTFGNSVDFGDLSVRRSDSGSAGSRTRAVMASGFGSGFSPGYGNTIDFVTIASQGDAQDFGDLTQKRRNITANSNSIRATFAGGTTTSSGTGNNKNIIDFVTISTTGNAVDFGDLQHQKRLSNMGSSDSHGGIGD